MEKNCLKTPIIQSRFREELILMPESISRCSGIIINGRCYKSFLFSTDVATITYTNADAILAVYPYTPHPTIIQAINIVSPVPVAAGVGGAVTSGQRSADIATFADAYGSIAVVLNSAVDVQTIKKVHKAVDIPIIYTVISDFMEIDEYIDAGVSILNISGGKDTAQIVGYFRKKYPEIPIIATGGRNEKYINETILAGANAITYTPPTTQSVFQKRMENYRSELKNDYYND